MSQSLATTPPAPADVPAYNPRNYLNAEAGIASWLFTRDHKRIGLMFLVLTAVAFAIGGCFAMLIRIFIEGLSTMSADWRLLFYVLAIATMTVGCCSIDASIGNVSICS